jgi:hypothetical protein
MKLLKRLTQKQKKIGTTPDLYQNSIEKFGRDQLTVLSKKGLGIRLTVA